MTEIPQLEEATVTVTVTVKMPIQTINDLFIEAIENGIGYWAHDIRVKVNTAGYPGTNFEKTPPWGCVIFFADHQGEYMINCNQAGYGLAKMSEKAPKHFANIMINDWDVETADVFFQFCIFERIIYG